MRDQFLSWLGGLCLCLGIASGCDTYTEVEYLHMETVDRWGTPSAAKSAYKPFSWEGVATVPDVLRRSDTEHNIVLRFYADGPRTVFVRAVRLSGANNQVYVSPLFAKEQSRELSEPLSKGGRTGLIALTDEIKNTALDALAASGSIQLEVEVKMSPTGQYTTLRYNLRRRVITKWATH